MEELIATVPEKDIASYLREAMVCYGAAAYRGCIVLPRKVKKLKRLENTVTYSRAG